MASRDRPVLQEARVNAPESGALLPLAGVTLERRHDLESPRLLNFDFVNEQRLGSRAILVHGVLSDSEAESCIAFIQQSGAEPATSRVDYRNNFRVIVSSPEFSAEVYRRVEPLLRKLGLHSVVVSSSNAEAHIDNGLGMLGEWELCRLNDCFRMCYYVPGGHFAPHYDADFVVDPLALRSFKTFMIYLNEDFEGGATNFVEDHQLHFDEESGKYCAPPETVFARVKPCRGDALIFDHKILHEGSEVLSGTKYMMRSELMYQRVSPVSEAESPRQRAMRLLHDAKLKEGEGQTADAIRIYRAVFREFPELQKLV